MNLMNSMAHLLFSIKRTVTGVPTNGLVFQLTFGSSTIPTTDSIGGYTLTPITNASYPSSPAIVLDATRGYVLATNIGTGLITSFIPSTASWSRCFWLKKNTTTNGGGNALSSLNYPIYSPTGKIQIDLNYLGAKTPVLDTTDRGLIWVHYVFTYDSTSKVCVLYVNGNAVSNATLINTIPTETQSLCIGNYDSNVNGANQYFDDIYCYSRALTSAEVLSVYNYVPPVVPVITDPTLFYHYKFNAGDINGSNMLANYATGTAVYDATVSGGAIIDTTTTKFGGGSLYLNNNYDPPPFIPTNPQFVTLPALTTDLSGISISIWMKTSMTYAFMESFSLNKLEKDIADAILCIPNKAVLVGASIVPPSQNLGLCNGNWVHLVWTMAYNGSMTNSTWVLYINGVSSTYTNLPYPAVLARPFCFLGASTYNKATPSASSPFIDPYYFGNIDDFRLYKRVLTATEATNLYTYNSTTGPTGLLSSIPAGCVGLFACKWVNNNYTGPILKLRKDATTTQDFYMDKTGSAIGTAVNGTGTSLTAWLGGATAYVETWYDQSGQTTPKNATQTNTTIQPTFDLTTKSVSINAITYLNIISNMYGTGNIPYSIIYKSMLASSLSVGGNSKYPTVFTSGAQGPPPVPNQSIYIICSTIDIQQDWYGTADFSYTRPASNNEVVSNTYDAVSRKMFINGTEVANNTPATKINMVSGTSYIGFFAGAATKFTGNIGFLCLFNTTLSDANRLIMEGI